MPSIWHKPRIIIVENLGIWKAPPLGRTGPGEDKAVTGQESAAPMSTGSASAEPSRRLRVLVFTMVFPNPGQPLHGTFVLERVRHLAALADIQVVAPVPWHHMLRRSARTPLLQSVVAVRYPWFWYVPKVLMGFRGLFMFLSAVCEVRRLRETFDFDLIDAHFAYPDGFAAILLGRWFRRPVCITLRGTIIPLSRRPLGRRLCDWAIRRAQRVIAVAHNLAERARQGGVPEDRIATIANSVDGGRFCLFDRAMARRELGLPEDGWLLVSVGHLSPRKGFHRVIRSLPQVIEAHDARLAIVGGKGAEPDNGAALHALAHELGLADKILFVGAQAPDRVALWLGAADAFVLASDFEGCPNVILEAMACGRPVIATKVGDVERMVPPFAGILLDDPEDAAALSRDIVAALTRAWDPERIRGQVAARSWDEVARQVEAQWRLAISAYDAEASGGSRATAENMVTNVSRSPAT
jgi:teichuronic acid biosynthesis glycosyltransferase TuaC